MAKMGGVRDDDMDAITACVELVGRTGAKEFEIGYLHDDVPADEAAWWCVAKLGGDRIIEENHVGPVQAAEALARRILTGAKCKCGKLVALSSLGAMFPVNSETEPLRMADGTTWTAAEARAVGQCQWRREGTHWRRGCEARPNRAQRRRR